MRLIPANGKLIVKEIEKISSSLIQIVRTEDSADKFVRGEVLEASKGSYSITGVWIDTKVKVGDIIWYNRFNGADITINRKAIIVLDEKEVQLTESQEDSE